MTTKSFPSGNVMRDGGLITVVGDAIQRGDVLTAANISLLCSQRFGDTFSDVTEAELAECIAFMGAATAEPDPVAAGDEVVLDAANAEHRPAPEMSRDEAQECVRIAAENVFAGRREVAGAEAERKAALAAVAEAVLVWQRGGRRPMTQDELKRETLRSNQMERERNAGFSRTAITTKQFVQKQMRTGKHRGSVDLVTLQHMRARVIREKAAAEAAKSQG